MQLILVILKKLAFFYNAFLTKNKDKFSYLILVLTWEIPKGVHKRKKKSLISFYKTHPDFTALFKSTKIASCTSKNSVHTLIRTCNLFL